MPLLTPEEHARFVDLMKRRGWSRRELAGLCGVSYSTVFTVFQNIRPTHPDTYKKLIVALEDKALEPTRSAHRERRAAKPVKSETLKKARLALVPASHKPVDESSEPTPEEQGLQASRCPNCGRVAQVEFCLVIRPDGTRIEQQILRCPKSRTRKMAWLVKPATCPVLLLAERRLA